MHRETEVHKMACNINLGRLIIIGESLSALYRIEAHL